MLHFYREEVAFIKLHLVRILGKNLILILVFFSIFRSKNFYQVTFCSVNIFGKNLVLILVLSKKIFISGDKLLKTSNISYLSE